MNQELAKKSKLATSRSRTFVQLTSFFKALLVAAGSVMGIISLTFLSGCGDMSKPDNDRTALGNDPRLVPDSQYYSLIEQRTAKQIIYDGFVNVMNTSATLMSTELTLAQVDHNARIYQYNDSQYQNEVGTSKSNLSKQTEIFLSFFVPDRKFDDLAKKTTHWRIFLDVGGQRYEPKVIKIKTQFAEVNSLYPNHTRWSTPYRLIFPVSTAISENGKAVLTLTGPLASTTLEFKINSTAQ